MTRYRSLLTRTRNVFNGYDTLAQRHVELKGAEQTRTRTMHPAAAPGDQHYQNYISNLAKVPMTQKYVAEHYVESLENVTDSDGSSGP